MYNDIPALVEALTAPLDNFAARFDQVAQDARLAAAARLWVCYLRLAEAQAAATALGPKLAAFRAETHVGMRVHHIHGVGLDLARILARLGQLHPAIEQLGLRFDGATMDRLTAEMDYMRQVLQATRSPNPRHFPDQDVIHSVQEVFAPFPAQLADITRRIRLIVSRYPGLGPNVQWRGPAAMSDMPLASDVGIDYTLLRDLLAAGSWQEAHVETQRAMLVAAGTARQRADLPPALFVEHILVFPCTDLRTVDDLWTWASDGHFGFSAQLGIYQGLGGTDEYDFTVWEAFCYHVGWITEEPIYDISAPTGHLPWIASTEMMGLDSHDAMVYSADADEEAHWRFLFGIFFDRVAQCLRLCNDRQAAAS